LSGATFDDGYAVVAAVFCGMSVADAGADADGG
jgi:hypothetical protein